MHYMITLEWKTTCIFALRWPEHITFIHEQSTCKGQTSLTTQAALQLIVKLHHKTLFIGCNSLLQLTVWFNAYSVISTFATVYMFMLSCVLITLTCFAGLISALTMKNTEITSMDPSDNFTVHTQCIQYNSWRCFTQMHVVLMTLCGLKILLWHIQTNNTQ
jgi:hypothetical protein